MYVIEQLCRIDGSTAAQQTSARMAGLRLHLAACTTPSSLNFWRMNTPERLAVVFVMTVNLPPRADEAADYR